VGQLIEKGGEERQRQKREAHELNEPRSLSQGKKRIMGLARRIEALAAARRGGQDFQGKERRGGSERRGKKKGGFQSTLARKREI